VRSKKHGSQTQQLHLRERHVAISAAGVFEVLPGCRLRQTADHQAVPGLAGHATTATTTREKLRIVQ
jgi:hypothetical protein